MCLSWAYWYLPCEGMQLFLRSHLWRTVPCLESDAMPEASVWFPESQTTFLFCKLWHNHTKHCPNFLCVTEEFLQRWRLEGDLLVTPWTRFTWEYRCSVSTCRHNLQWEERLWHPVASQLPYKQHQTQLQPCNHLFLFFFWLVMPTALCRFFSIPSQLFVCISEEIIALIIRLTAYGLNGGPVTMAVASCSWLCCPI